MKSREKSKEKKSPKRIILFFILLTFIFSPNVLISKEVKVEKELLLTKLKMAKDSEKSAILNKLAKAYWWDKDRNLVLKYGKDALKYAKKFRQEKEKFQALCSIAHAYWRLRDNKSSLMFAKKAVKLSKKRDKRDQLYALSILSSIYEYMKFTKKNLKRFLKTEKLELKISENLKDKKEIVNHVHRIGSIYSALTDYEKAYEYRKRAFRLYKEMGNTKRVIQFLTYFPFYEKKLGDKSKIPGYYLKEEKLAKENKYEKLLCRVYFTLGNYYKDNKNYEKSINYFKKGAFIAEKKKYYWWSANLLSFEAEALFQKGDYETALTVADKTIEVNKKNNRTNKLTVDLIIDMIKGKVLWIRKKYDKALGYFTRVFLQSSNEVENELISKSLKNIGLVYMKKKNYRRSIPFLKKSLKYAINSKRMELAKDVSLLLSDVYLKLGKNKKSQKYKKNSQKYYED